MPTCISWRLVISCRCCRAQCPTSVAHGTAIFARGNWLRNVKVQDFSSRFALSFIIVDQDKHGRKSKMCEALQLPANVLHSFTPSDPKDRGVLNVFTTPFQFLQRWELRQNIVSSDVPKCECCGGGMMDRRISWARTDDDDDGPTCFCCHWIMHLCTRCLFVTHAHPRICASCFANPRETKVALRDINIARHQ